MEDRIRMPAEWEEHDATWIAWPHFEDDWPGKLECINWLYVEFVRLLASSERVEIICHDEAVQERARRCLERHSVSPDLYRFHRTPMNRSWLRDSGPTGVYVGEDLSWIDWRFNAWAKYDNYELDEGVPEVFSAVAGGHRITPMRADGVTRLVAEGGALEVDGEGTLLITEECFLSREQERNPGASREEYERLFRQYLGVQRTIWLGSGVAGDDTHGHIDDIARFVGPGRVVLAFESNSNDVNFDSSCDNFNRLRQARDADGRELEVIRLPFPSPLFYDGERLPASYANFYIGNSVVLVPTFHDPNDRVALNILAELFPTRRVIGVHSVDLVLGYGTLHCLTQQQPASRGGRGSSSPSAEGTAPR